MSFPLPVQNLCCDDSELLRIDLSWQAPHNLHMNTKRLEILLSQAQAITIQVLGRTSEPVLAAVFTQLCLMHEMTSALDQANESWDDPAIH